MKISQIGLVVADVRKTVERYIATENIGPWRMKEISTISGASLTLNGEKNTSAFSFVTASVQIGEIELELIEPGDGKSIYRDFLAQKGEGLHHLRVKTDTGEDFRNFIDHMQKENIPVFQEYTCEAGHIISFDTWNELGVVLEAAERLSPDDPAGSTPAETFPEGYVASDNIHKMNIRQFAVVVRNAEVYMDNYCRLLGVSSFDVRHFRPENMKSLYVEGELQTEGYEFICAVAWLENIEIEVIEPIKGKNIYWEFLDTRGEGFHHIKDVYPDQEIARETERMKEYGIRIMQTGWIDGDRHYYMSTFDELKMIVEYGNGGKIGPPDYCYPKC